MTAQKKMCWNLRFNFWEWNGKFNSRCLAGSLPDDGFPFILSFISESAAFHDVDFSSEDKHAWNAIAEFAASAPAP